VQIAGSLNLTAIAEIIETEAAAKALQEMGCEYGQGYYFSEPLEAEPALQRLHSQEPFQPPQETSATLKIRSLEDSLEDSLEREGSRTIAMPFARHSHQSPQQTSATMKIRPLEETSATVKIPPLEETSATVKIPPLEEASATVKIPPLEEASATVKIPPLEEASATVRIRSLKQDDSPTTMIPVCSLDCQQEEEPS
jgi:hypothetical protein